MNPERIQSKKSPESVIAIKDLAVMGMSAAVLTVISQISIPLPTGIPITIQLFGVAFIGAILGWKKAVVSVLAYILLGAVGLPVFSNFSGGLGILFGLTGGYILAWPVTAAFCGVRPQTGTKTLDTVYMILFALIGLAIDEFAGGAQWAALSGDLSGRAILVYSLTVFVPKDIILTIVGILTGQRVRKALRL